MSKNKNKLVPYFSLNMTLFFSRENKAKGVLFKGVTYLWQKILHLYIFTIYYQNSLNWYFWAKPHTDTDKCCNSKILNMAINIEV
jgi:hypothetical protein